MAWRLSPAEKTARVARGNARAPRARGVVTVRGLRMWWHGGALVGGSAVAQRQQGVADDHRWGLEEAPGKKIGDGAHRDVRATVGRREAASVAVFNGGGVASVVVDVRGGVLQLEGDLGVWRRRSIEGKNSPEGRSPEGGGRR
jgi:hypothetical protein